MTGKKHIARLLIVAILLWAVPGVAFKDFHHLFAHEHEVHCEMHFGDHFHESSEEDCAVCDLQVPLHLLSLTLYSTCTQNSPELKKVHKPNLRLNWAYSFKFARAPPAV